MTGKVGRYGARQQNIKEKSMLDKIIDVAKQNLDDYKAELMALIVLENEGKCEKNILIDARNRLNKLSYAIDKVLEGE